MKHYTKELTQDLLTLEYQDIPSDVISLAKKHFLDCVGCALAEVSQQRSHIVQRYFDRLGADGDCRILGSGRKLTVDNAAFATGILAHTICFDDSGPSHPSVTVVPCLLAMGEKYRIPGKKILAAQVAGYDLFQRLNAVTADAWDMRKRGWHPTGFFGSVASAVESSRLLELDTNTTQMAMGIASSLSGGLSQNIGNMTMGLHAGNASRNGVVAAHLAQEGFTADPQPFEGRFGLLDALCGPGTYDASVLTKDFGSPLKLKDPGITIKPYPNCWAHHKVYQAVIQLVKEKNIQADQVEKILIDLQNDKPTYRYLHPRNDLEARYSLGYGVALAVLDGELTLKQYADDRIQREDTLQMMNKIQDTHMTAGKDQNRVTIILKNGTEYTNEVAYSKGHPKMDPFTLEEVKEKYRLCAGMTLPTKQVEESMEMILHLEQVDHLDSLLDKLVLS